MSDQPVCVLADRDTVSRIRVRGQATSAEDYAAEDLRLHLRRMTGQPVVDRGSEGSGTLYLNDWEAAAAAGITPEGLKLTGDAFHLATRGNDLHLLAASDRGILYAASDVLRRLGARWYTPTISRLPALREAVLPALDETVRPAFEYRDMIAKDCAAPEFLMRLRVNGHFCRIPGYLGGHQAYGMHVHTFYRLVPPAKYFDAHPEYFSLVDGKRRASGAQLCLTHPDVCRIAVDGIRAAIAANPNARIFSVSQNDWGGACQCPTCRQVVKEEGSEAGPVLRFANAVADAIAATDPDILISTLAYTYTLDAPRKAVPRPNVRVRLCPITCCQGHPFGTCDHPETQRFVRAFGKWSARMSQMYIWHYAIDFTHCALPMPNFDELWGNLRYYRDHGVYGVFIQDMGESGFGSESSDLRGFLQAELLWNPDADVWRLVQEWVTAVHGRAAPGVMRYYRLFHDFVKRHRDVHPVCYAKPDHPLYNRKLLAKVDEALAESERMASGFSRQRIQILRAGIKLPHLYTCGGHYTVRGNRFAGAATPQDVRAIDTIAKRWKAYGITHPGESQALDEAVNMWRARIAPHRLLRFRAGGDELRLAPTLGGRLLTWSALGRQWLAPPDPDNPHQAYPFSGGYAELVITGVHSYLGWQHAYRVLSRAPDRVTLAATVTHWSCGTLALTRTFTLEGEALVIDSRVENRGTAPRQFRWDACLQWEAGTHAVLTIPTPDGSARLTTETLDDGFAKARTIGVRPGGGTWRMELDGAIITNAFDAAITEIVAGRNAAKGIVAINVRSGSLTLAPGAGFETRQTVRITASNG